MPTVRPVGLVTDATVAERVAAASSAADHRALAAYYRDKAKGEAARIAYYDALFRSYMQLPEKPYEPMQRQARQLLKAARMTSKYFELLASAHTTMALELSEEQ